MNDDCDFDEDGLTADPTYKQDDISEISSKISPPITLFGSSIMLSPEVDLKLSDKP